jgi:translocation and assembly module TamA
VVAFRPLDRLSVRLIVVFAATVVACADRPSAQAFDFFGLWGSDEVPPPLSRTAISYAVTIDIRPDDKELKTAVEDASSLYKLREDPPPDGDALARRAQSDFGPIIDAMWGAGYYDAAVTISIGRASLSILSSDIASFARVAERKLRPNP